MKQLRLVRPTHRGLVVDLFAGGGGASTGLEAALGRSVDIAVNHDRVALLVHEANHPWTKHLKADVFDVRPRRATRGRRVSALWASPDCTHHSKAKGGKPLDSGRRALADVVVKWAAEVRPDVIFLENVPEFVDWGPLDADGKPIKVRKGEEFRRWKGELEVLGYVVEFRILVASDYGAPTSRRRLFLVARRDRQPIRWPEPTHGPGLLPYRTAAECIDWSIPAPSIFLTRAEGRALGIKRPLAENTLRRIAMGMRKFVFESPGPYIVRLPSGEEVAPTLIQTGYGEREGQRPRFLDLHQPLGTIVAGGPKHAVVMAFLAKHYGGNMTPGSSLRDPMGTITTQDHHGLVTATLDGPPANTNQVRAFLAAFYGTHDLGQSLRDPLRTITTRDRFGLVTVAGEDRQITDIGMRMLRPHELLRAQFGRFAANYDMSAAGSASDEVRLIGNSVCPEAAEVLVRANLAEHCRHVLEAA